MKKLLALLLMLTIMLVLCAGCSGRKEEKAQIPAPEVKITLTDGNTIQLELYPSVAPNTVANFVSLIQEGFYDGLTFHRVIAGFMIQGGDPLGNGTGGPGYCIRGEFKDNGVENGLSHTRGVLSMARSSDFDSAGSQFFIMHGTADYLDGQYAAFGKIMGEDNKDNPSYRTLDLIANTATDLTDKPQIDYVIQSITVDTKGYRYTPVKIEK